MNKYGRLLPSLDQRTSVTDVSANSRNTLCAQGERLLVTLHVYDVSHHSAVRRTNGVLSKMGTGAFHSAVEVNGREWSFGATELAGVSGVCSCAPAKNDLYSYFKAVPLGYTALSIPEVWALLRDLADEWQGEDYDLLRCNCCHFCSELSRRLGVADVPRWVINLAGVGAVLEDSFQSASDGFQSASSQVRQCKSDPRQKSREMSAAMATMALKMAGNFRDSAKRVSACGYEWRDRCADRSEWNSSGKCVGGQWGEY